MRVCRTFAMRWHRQVSTRGVYDSIAGGLSAFLISRPRASHLPLFRVPIPPGPSLTQGRSISVNWLQVNQPVMNTWPLTHPGTPSMARRQQTSFVTSISKRLARQRTYLSKIPIRISLLNCFLSSTSSCSSHLRLAMFVALSLNGR